jgi:hypothetical protein
MLQRRILRVDGGVVPADEDINWPTSVSRLDGVLDRSAAASSACMRCYVACVHKPARGLTGF